MFKKGDEVRLLAPPPGIDYLQHVIGLIGVCTRDSHDSHGCGVRYFDPKMGSYTIWGFYNSDLELASVKRPVLPEPDMDLDEIHLAQSLMGG